MLSRKGELFVCKKDSRFQPFFRGTIFVRWRKVVMKMKLTAEKIYEEFTKGKSYKSSIDLFETVRVNENFYIGKQWEGCNAPDLDKPVINVLRRVVSFFISMIVSNDVSASYRPFEETETIS